MDKVCAYCGEARPLTADHVWPNSFLDRFGRNSAHFSVRSRKVHGGDYVIKDVCETCNSDKLSPLDTYFCRLYDEYFVHLHDFDSTVNFRHDYTLLARSLLKISYNTARQGVSDPSPLASLRGFVLGHEPCPARLAIFAELVSPTMVPQPDGSICKIMPNMYRSMLSRFPWAGGDRILLRMIAVNSFYFHLLIPLEMLSQTHFEEMVSQFPQRREGVVRLSPGIGEVAIHTSPQDGIRSILPQLGAYREQYRQFFAKKRLKK